MLLQNNDGFLEEIKVRKFIWNNEDNQKERIIKFF